MWQRRQIGTQTLCRLVFSVERAIVEMNILTTQFKRGRKMCAQLLCESADAGFNKER